MGQGKVNLNQITPYVYNEVANIMASTGGNKEAQRTINNDIELEQLQKLLSTGDLKAAEKEYIEGLMLEYTTKRDAANAEAEKREQESHISPQARKDLETIKKGGVNPNEVDEADANQILGLIQNVRGTYNKAEVEFFKQELIKAGFGDLLLEDNKPNKANEGVGAETINEDPKPQITVDAPESKEPENTPPTAEGAAEENPENPTTVTDEKQDAVSQRKDGTANEAEEVKEGAADSPKRKNPFEGKHDPDVEKPSKTTNHNKANKKHRRKRNSTSQRPGNLRNVPNKPPYLTPPGYKPVPYEDFTEKG